MIHIRAAGQPGRHGDTACGKPIGKGVAVVSYTAWPTIEDGERCGGCDSIEKRARELVTERAS